VGIIEKPCFRLEYLFTSKMCDFTLERPLDISQRNLEIEKSNENTKM